MFYLLLVPKNFIYRGNEGKQLVDVNLDFFFFFYIKHLTDTRKFAVSGNVLRPLLKLFPQL